MSPELRRYLELERAMLALDEVRDPRADTLRDAMDPLWFDLSDEEQGWLNSRQEVPLHRPRCITLVVGREFYVEPMTAEFRAAPGGPIKGWYSAA